MKKWNLCNRSNWDLWGQPRVESQALFECAHHEATRVRFITPPCPWSPHNCIFLFSFPAVSVSLFPRYHALQFFLSPDCCFHFCEDRISTGMDLWIHGEGKRSREPAVGGGKGGQRVSDVCYAADEWQSDRELVQSSAVSVSNSSSALRHWVSVYVKFALGKPGAALWFTRVHGRWRGQTSLSLFIRLCFCLCVSCSGRIGCACLKSLKRLLLFTECVFLSDTLPVSQSAGRVKSVCESLYAR